MFSPFRYFRVTRNIKAEEYLEILLATAVFTILCIRFYLYLTHYPTVGSGNLHIAHMLWGGLIMLGCILLYLSVYATKIHTVIAIFAGVGFGLFIDELGKFITKNNDYFFQPSVAIMYYVFVILYLCCHYLLKTKRLTEDEYYINALELFKQSYFHPTRLRLKHNALALLERCNLNDPMVKSLYTVIKTSLHDQQGNNRDLTFTFTKYEKKYITLLNKKGFNGALIIIFTLYTATDLFIVSQSIVHNSDFSNTPIFLDLQIISLLSTVFLVVLGLIEIRKSRSHAYHLFQFALYISLYLTQFFVFYAWQFLGLVGVLIDLIFLISLRNLMKHESTIALHNREINP